MREWVNEPPTLSSPLRLSKGWEGWEVVVMMGESPPGGGADWIIRPPSTAGSPFRVAGYRRVHKGPRLGSIPLLDGPFGTTDISEVTESCMYDIKALVDCTGTVLPECSALVLQVTMTHCGKEALKAHEKEAFHSEWDIPTLFAHVLAPWELQKNLSTLFGSFLACKYFPPACRICHFITVKNTQSFIVTSDSWEACVEKDFLEVPSNLLKNTEDEATPVCEKEHVYRVLVKLPTSESK